ncbi:MAG: GMP synthase [Bacteroidota bacterium]
MNKQLRLAILDMYNGTPNQGMRCIQEIVARYATTFQVQVFDVRGKAEVPNIEDFDIFISTGGPGDPRKGDGIWDGAYYAWLDAVWNWNRIANQPSKYVFFICHSFQMACHHFGLGEITERRSMSFGTFPIHMTDKGATDVIFKGLHDPFWAADFRSYQLIQPDVQRMQEIGAEILALEKIRPHVPLERAIMGMRFSKEMVAVQFHPEADADGMLLHFQDEHRKQNILEEHGADKYQNMLRDLKDAEKIEKTNNTVIPNFLNFAIKNLTTAPELVHS